MRLPISMLERVRGTLVAVAMAGCASPASVIAPEPVSEVPERSEIAAAAGAPDPVVYDGSAEAVRLARLEETLAVRAARRDRRIEAVRLAELGDGPGLGSIGVASGRRWSGVGCGRG